MYDESPMLISTRYALEGSLSGVILETSAPKSSAPTRRRPAASA
jgi:hypothetical protein